MTIRTFLHLPPLLLTASVLAGFALAVHAADLDTPARSERVSFASRDLSSPHGISALYARIRTAASSVCSPFEGRELAQVQQHEECVQQAIDGAIVQVANRDLTAYAEARSLHRHARTAPAALSAVNLPLD